MRMKPWVPTMTPHQVRRVGKTIEELGELLAVLGRINIQDIDAIDPGSGKTNRQRLMEEMADVYAQLDLNVDSFKFDLAGEICDRIKLKQLQMEEWEAHFK